MHARWNQFVLVVAMAALSAIAGFAYGNASKDALALEKWQPLTGALVAIAIGVLAWSATRATARLNVLIHEEKRLEESLPKWLQISDFVGRLAEYVSDLQQRSNAALIIRDYVRLEVGKQNVQEAMEKLLPNADRRLLREFSDVIGSAYYLANIMRIRELEIAREEAMIARHDTADGALVRNMELLEKLKQAATRDELLLNLSLSALRSNAKALTEKTKRAQKRLVDIRGEIDRYFSD